MQSLNVPLYPTTQRAKAPDVPMIIPELNDDHAKVIPFQQSVGTKRDLLQ